MAATLQSCWMMSAPGKWANGRCLEMASPPASSAKAGTTLTLARNIWTWIAQTRCTFGPDWRTMAGQACNCKWPGQAGSSALVSGRQAPHSAARARMLRTYTRPRPREAGVPGLQEDFNRATEQLRRGNSARTEEQRLLEFRKGIWVTWERRSQQEPDRGHCIACGQMHLVRHCPAILKLARKPSKKDQLAQALAEGDHSAGCSVLGKHVYMGLVHPLLHGRMPEPSSRLTPDEEPRLGCAHTLLAALPQCKACEQAGVPAAVDCCSLEACRSACHGNASHWTHTCRCEGTGWMQGHAEQGCCAGHAPGAQLSHQRR